MCREKARSRRADRRSKDLCGCGAPLNGDFRKCAACRESNRKWIESNPEHAKAIRREASLKWSREHKDECRERIRHWQLEHKDQCKMTRQRFRARHPETDMNASARRRAHIGDATITKEQWLEIMSTWEWRCAYCSAVLSDSNVRTIDHVIPLTRGGRHHVSNLVACCRPCNLSKKNRLLSEWDTIPAMPQVVAKRLATMIQVSTKISDKVD
jgi:5-methylcytosine-specific restriction endonuclease McrA